MTGDDASSGLQLCLSKTLPLPVPRTLKYAADGS